MAAALGLALTAGDVLVSVGTSGVASTVSSVPVADGSGAVTGFADATGGFLPMAITMNAARILDLQAAAARRRPTRSWPSSPSRPRPAPAE